MDNQLTQDLQAWLEAEKKDHIKGAEILLALTRNNSLARTYLCNPQKYGAMVEGILQKFLVMRLDQKTAADVAQMRTDEEAAARRMLLEKPLPKKGARKVQLVAISTEAGYGKRADHYDLPDEIKALYEDNLHILRAMRALHAQLLLITDEATRSKSYCINADVYPVVKEILSLDKEYRSNWQKYDEYKK